jgi:hypothetical protein
LGCELDGLGLHCGGLLARALLGWLPCCWWYRGSGWAVLVVQESLRYSAGGLNSNRRLAGSRSVLLTPY